MPIKLRTTPPTPKQPTPSILEQAAALQISEETEDSIPEVTNPLLKKTYSNQTLPSDLSERFLQIEKILAIPDTPIDTLRLACQAVMHCVKKQPELLELFEDEDYQLVVRGYKQAADESAKKILEPKKKKAAKAALKEFENAKPLSEDEMAF